MKTDESTITLISDYGSIRVETFDKRRITRSSENNDQKVEQMKEALESISIVGNEFGNTVKKFKNKPKEVELELGLKFSIESGVIIAKTSADATFKVTIKWSNDEL